MRKKILQVITLSEWGGAQRVVYDLSCNLNRERFLVEVACSPGGALVKKLRDSGIKVYEISSLKREICPWWDIKALFQLWRLIRKGKYDVVHCHSTKAGFLGRLSAKLAKVKQIYFTVHSWSFYNEEEYGKEKRLFIILERFAVWFCDKIICVAEKVKRDGLKNKITKAQKFEVIHNGIDFEVKETKEAVRKQLAIAQDKIIVSMVARLAYPKDPLLFLEAAKKVKEKMPSVKFVLIGDGPLMGKCKEFIFQQRLDDTVALLGEKPPEITRSLVKASDIFVLCSKFEGLPITILEAAFSGLPVVASNVGGVGELVKDGQNGFLLRVQTAKELAKRIIYLAKNPDRARQMGQKGLEAAENDFSVKKMVDAYQALYLSVLSDP